MPRDEAEQEPVVVRDRRRIDPETGQRRAPVSNGADAGQANQPGAGAQPAPGARPTEEGVESMSGTLDDELAKVGAQPEGETAAETVEPDAGLQQQVDELTADLKRVTAEYANYRKRVERDREGVIESAKASVAGDLLTVLDDLDRAESHGDLNGAFKAMADKLIGSLNAAGLAAFGQEGDEFDPSVHEAVQHMTSSDVSGPTVTTVMRRGYRFGERVLRPAMVAVTEYEPTEAAEPVAESGDNGVDQS